MKRTLTSLFTVALFTGICLLASAPTKAQSKQAIETPSVNNSTGPATCPDAQMFTTGSGASELTFCISVNGNVYYLVSPAGKRHIYQEEGYIACATGVTSAYDEGYLRSGWNSATAPAQPNGPKTFPLTITRQSTDGKFELKQTFDWNTQKKEIAITMSLKNLSGAAMPGTKLARFFRGSFDSNVADDRYDASADSIWGRSNGPTGHGLILTALTFNQSHTPAATSFANWPNDAATCTPITEPVPTSIDNHIGRLTYNLGTVNAGASKTVKVLYKRF